MGGMDGARGWALPCAAPEEARPWGSRRSELSPSSALPHGRLRARPPLCLMPQAAAAGNARGVSVRGSSFFVLLPRCR